MVCSSSMLKSRGANSGKVQVSSVTGPVVLSLKTRESTGGNEGEDSATEAALLGGSEAVVPVVE